MTWSFSLPPFWKRGAWGDLNLPVMENPPKSPFQKGDLKETGLFYNSLRARFGRLGWGTKPKNGKGSAPPKIYKGAHRPAELSFGVLLLILILLLI